MSDSTDLKLIIQPPPVLRATITPPADFKTTIEESAYTLIVQPPTELKTVIQPPNEVKTTLLIGQGPSGPPGGEEMKYTKRIDFVGNNVIYKGEAAPGTLQDAPNWRIRRLTIINEDIIEEWADGTAEMNKVWSSRDTYSYS